eukprot:TRINITY_DN3831_c1_g1_i2.p1 TRINITY_DN3831_c1_g1~~TRINITY_DN3831_c1_g1_i2.p1  ORF type:complete len:908 (+),score=144.83 TRINITY_DN3831_c1_g1_i2:23-2725(+)
MAAMMGRLIQKFLSQPGTGSPVWDYPGLPLTILLSFWVFVAGPGGRSCSAAQTAWLSRRDSTRPLCPPAAEVTIPELPPLRTVSAYPKLHVSTRVCLCSAPGARRVMRGPAPASAVFLILLRCAPLHAACDWSARTQCNWTTTDEGLECAHPTLGRGACLVDGECLGCGDGRFMEALSCAACAALDGYWCASQSLCMDAPVPDRVFNDRVFPRWNVACEGTWMVTCPARNFSHPAKLFEAQEWVYDLSNVKPAWAEGWTGQGVMVQVNDDGIVGDHPEFAGRFRRDLSCSTSEPANPEVDSHGTTCASIAVGASDGNCSAGIAPQAELSSCTLLRSRDPALRDEDTTAREAQDGTYLALNLNDVDISSNSWGFSVCNRKPFGASRGAAGQQFSDTFSCPFRPGAPFTPCDGACSWGANFDRGDEECQRSINRYCYFEHENDPSCEDFLDMFLEPCYYNAMDPASRAAMAKAVWEGRGGKGVVFVFAAGNAHGEGTHVGMAAPQNSRLTITVGAVGKDGRHASYSTPGAALFISAPGGDFDSVRNHYTAWSNLAAGTCWSAGVGTSYAGPVVTGVVALVLQANPDLHWRDVQGVLQQSANSQAPQLQDGQWTTNSAGVRHHMKYGFGLVDAARAVETAKAWVSWEKERLSSAGTHRLNLTIPDNGRGAVSSNLTVDNDMVVESVVVYVNMTHPSRGDVDVVLKSPGGTTSLLHPGKRPEHAMTETWKLMSVVHWGERSEGVWKLTLRDRVSGERPHLTCADMNFETVTRDGMQVTCSVLALHKVCEDGGEGPYFADLKERGIVPKHMDFHAYMTEELAMDDGSTPLTHCCACGGGQSPNAVAETLNGWSIMLYGRPPPTPPPTPVPMTPWPLLKNITDGAHTTNAAPAAGLLVTLAAAWLL